KAIEEGFVGILDIAQVDVLVDFRFESLILDPCTLSLFFNRFDDFRQQPQQVETATLFHTECASFVQQGKFQENGASVGNIKRTRFFAFGFHITHSFLNIVPGTYYLMRCRSTRASGTEYKAL